jgi:hypothetical protein
LNRRLSILLALCLFLGAALYLLRLGPGPGSPQLPAAISPAAQPDGQIDLEQQRLDRSVWARELQAQECGRVLEDLWDALNQATNQLRLAAAFPLHELILGQWDEGRELPHGIRIREQREPSQVLSAQVWQQTIEDLDARGWRLAQTEFRHTAFDADEAGQAKQSRFYFSAHLTNSLTPQRATVVGDLTVDWAPRSAPGQPPSIGRVDARHLTLQTRSGEPPFRPILTETVLPPEGSFFIDPLILYDLDGDGLSEIILAAKNLVFHRQPDGIYQSAPLCRYPPGLIFTGIIADFDGDGFADFLCAKFEGLMLFKGSARGTFDEPGQMVWTAPRHLRYVNVLTCGDIDRDGDLDVFLGQYKLPYEGGSMPTPYYDANDGNPSYLLLNDGHGKFSDATTAAGLGQKRWRRSYSGSFVDLDGDGHLDLVVVSDFAGLDVYRNDGHGHFTEVTGAWVPESHAFGMGHTLADFNADGRLDLLMLGMPSAAVDRLEHLNLWRPELQEDRTMRARMSYGNRLYLARASGGFEHTALSDSIARSGWSWGCSAFDCDNDGYPDVYVANGHESKQSVADYDPEFWLHDIYVGDSKDSPATYAYFNNKISRTRGRGRSYGGYDKNRLFLNQQGTSFTEVGHLMGLALEQDSRNVVADDLDGDGRVDVLVTTFEVWPQMKQTLRVYQNTLPDCGNWIGFRFREGEPGRSPVGTQLTLRYSGRTAVRHLLVGDSYRSQHANTLHFGIGKAERIDAAEIRWPDGKVLELKGPGLNQYHLVK